MKRITKLLLLFVCSLICAISCQKAPFLTMTGTRTFNFTRDGGSQSFAFSTNQDWSIASSQSWCRVSPTSGTSADGDITITITVDNNSSFDNRSCTLTIRANGIEETITVNQESALGLIVSPTTFNITNAAQTIEVEVQKNVNYLVVVDDACKNWIQNAGTKALSSEIVLFNISANDSYDGREGKITFMQAGGTLSQTVIIKQSQTNGLFVTTPEYEISNAQHTLSIEIKANVEFEVTSQAEWIKYVETKALKPSTVVLSIEANGTFDSRTGNVIVKQKNGDLSGIITITQKQTDGLFVTPNSFQLSNQQQSVEVTVNNNVSYSIVIPDEARSWISVQSTGQTKALAEDKVILSIANNNTYSNREASVTFKQTDGVLAQTVAIHQEQTDGLFVTTSEYSVSNCAQSVNVDINSNVEYDVTSQVDWISVVETKALVSSTIELAIEANESYNNRTGTVVVKQKNGLLSKTISIFQKQTDVLIVSPTSFEIISEEQTIEVAVSTNISYNVDIPEAASSWVKLSSSPTISGYETINVLLKIAQNPALNSRETTVTIKQTDGDLKEQITILQQPGDGTVDLGLPSGKKWAIYPLGASSEYSYARCFNLLKDANITDTYAHSAWNQWYFGGTPYTNITGTTNDPAQALGKNWHTPTINEFLELENNCTFEKFEYNGNDYVRATSKINGNSLVFVNSFWNKQRSNQYPVLYWAADIYVYEGYYFAPYFFFPLLDWRYGFASDEYYSGEIPDELYESYNRVLSNNMNSFGFILPIYY